MDSLRNADVAPNWVEYDPVAKCRRSYYEIEDGVIAVKTEYEIDDLVDLNAERRAAAPKQWGDGAVVASIPLNIYMKLFAPALRQHDEAYIRRILNDSDFAKFRTRDGKL